MSGIQERLFHLQERRIGYADSDPRPKSLLSFLGTNNLIREQLQDNRVKSVKSAARRLLQPCSKGR